MKRYFELIIILLLSVNGVFLFLKWNDQRVSVPRRATPNEILLYEMEVSATLSSLRERSLAVDVLVRKNHCGVCVDEALPYWLMLINRVPTTIFYYSPSPSVREGERFAQQFGIPDSIVRLEHSISPSDSLLWSSNSPAVIVRDSQSGIRYLVHIGSSDNPSRTAAFYKALVATFGSKT